MQSRVLLYSEDARTKLKEGIDAVANMVKVTLGPKGKNVILDRKYGGPLVTKDGVTVAKEVFLKDPAANMGAQLLKQVASKTADVAGDGTTTATVLAQAIITEGIKRVIAKANPMDIKRGIDIAVKQVIAYLGTIKRDVSGKEDIIHVGTISANNDKEIGNIIANAMEEVGNDGVITVEESSSAETFLDVVDGLQFDRGYVSPYFATKVETLEAVLDNPYIILHSGPINVLNDLVNILNEVAQNSKSLLLISDDLSTDVLKALVVNKMQGRISVCAVKAPGFGDRRKDILEDIAVATGGKVIDADINVSLKSATLLSAGRCSRVVVTKDKTVIINGRGSEEALQARVNQIRALISLTESDYDKQKLQERLAKLSGGVAVIRVGGATEAEMQEKKARIEDALHATRAAVEEGIVPGGGIAYIRCTGSLDAVRGANEDQNMGIAIIRAAIQEPFKAIVRNGGGSPEVLLSRIVPETLPDVEKIELARLDFGYNALTDKLENLYDSGVIDPVKVVRSAIENAASIANLFLTTEGLIAESLEEKKEFEDMMRAGQ